MSIEVTQRDRDAADDLSLGLCRAEHRRIVQAFALHAAPLREALERIAADGPENDPGPAFDDGWVSHGNYDDVAYDSRREVQWRHRQIALAALSPSYPMENYNGSE